MVPSKTQRILRSIVYHWWKLSYKLRAMKQGKKWSLVYIIIWGLLVSACSVGPRRKRRIFWVKCVSLVKIGLDKLDAMNQEGEEKKNRLAWIQNQAKSTRGRWFSSPAPHIFRITFENCLINSPWWIATKNISPACNFVLLARGVSSLKRRIFWS